MSNRSFPFQPSESVLFITLDSCRYDTFVAATVPNLGAVGELYLAKAPGNFTYASHMAMFMGFTPGDPALQASYVNPKYGKIFRMGHGGIAGKGGEHYLLNGHNVINGFKRLGYHALGTGAVGWFNPETETSGQLIGDFDDFFYPGNTWSLEAQLDWLANRIAAVKKPVFAFLNVGETHVPYYFNGAPWARQDNPCVPFSDANDAEKCRTRQKRALEFVDERLSGLLQAFAAATTVVCADHGDCWGEDGLWEHGISHDKVLDVPLLFRLGRVADSGYE